MRRLLERLSQAGPYRPASAGLILLVYLLPFTVAQLGGPKWLGFLVGLPLYVALIVLTYHRLRNAGLSGGWIILMILALNFGPKWQGPEPLVFYASHLLHFVPVALGWLFGDRPAEADAAPNAGQGPKAGRAEA